MVTMNYARALEVAIHTAQEAGHVLREEFHRPGNPHLADHGNALDKKVEQLIRRELTAFEPDWGYRGEETGYQPAKLTGRLLPHLWLIDPSDGTSSFLAGARSSAVSIALLRDGEPVLGVVYAFAAPDDEGDLFAWAEGCGPIRRNGLPVQRPPWATEIGPQCIVLVSQDGDRNSSANQQCVHPGRYLKVPGIAYRLALVAVGEGEVGVSLNSPVGWDYAAGHALLIAAGGNLIDENGNRVTYSAKGDSAARMCVGGAPILVHEVLHRPWHLVHGKATIAAQDPHLPAPFVRLEPGSSVGDPGVLRRAQGALLGQLVGDALGSLVEFQSPAEIRNAYPNGPRWLEDGGTWHTIGGQPTDDSEEALMLARSLVAHSAYDEEAVARAYEAWYQSQPFDLGTTTAQALRAARGRRNDGGNVASAMKAGANHSSQSNGSLMRMAPLGIWGHCLPPDQVATFARADSALTHPHPVCQEACAVFAVALAHAVATGGGAQDAYEFAFRWAKDNCVQEPVLDALGLAYDAPPTTYTHNAGWVLIAFQNAFHQLLWAPSLEEAIVRTASAGGDADTNACICGALLGAAQGRDAVPLQWRQMVLSCRPIAGLPHVHRPRPASFWPVDALELAERLLLAHPASVLATGPSAVAGEPEPVLQPDGQPVKAASTLR